ncbi:MAG: glutamate--tRNA ligase [Phycisphaerales bacterium]|nr:glutamate--tRNA ligase [Phycisphaerales bacterium]
MTQPNTIVTRFAPSPSGYLHVGGARTALFGWAYAKGRGGRFILRIEDTDQKRSSESASIGFLKDLCWLGIGWDEGPEFESFGGGDRGSYFQSERLDIYNTHLTRLIDAGQAYWAFDTPAELDAQRQAAKARGNPYRYEGTTARNIAKETVQQWLTEGRAAVIRFHTPTGPIVIEDEILGSATIPAGEVDDFVIRKADGFPTYHFAVVVDDELMGVTHVLRAQEHFNNTAKHMVLQDALGFRRPIYGHLPLIFNPDGSKMSKRDKDKLLRKASADRKMEQAPAGTVDAATFAAWRGDKTMQLPLADAERLAASLGVSLPEINVDDFRRSGYLPQVLCNFLALNGWSPGNNLEKFDNEFLQRTFDLSRVVKTPAKFDRMKLLAFNCDALQAMTAAEFTVLARAHGLSEHPEFMTRLSESQFVQLASASHERSKTLEDMFKANRFLILPDAELPYDMKSVLKVLVSGGGEAHLRAARDLLAKLSNWDAHSIEQLLKGYAEANTAGELGKVAQPLRVAVSGGTVSPPIFDTLAILGSSSVLARIDRALTMAAAQPRGTEAATQSPRAE